VILTLLIIIYMRFNIGDKKILLEVLKDDYNLEKNIKLNCIAIDSNTVKKGDMFIAIKGENVNGHKFIDAAINNGASLIVSSERIEISTKIGLIKTSCTKKFIKDIATKYRSKFKLKIIAITGTNGKTTTKELLYDVINKKFHTFKNKGNFNSTIGLPLSILNINKNIEFGVVELGASRTGEIGLLSNIVKPYIGVITNISIAHLETFKTFNNIIKTKLELFENIQKNGYIVRNVDDQNIRESNKIDNDVSYGYENKADYKGKILSVDGGYKILVGNDEFFINKNCYSILYNFLPIYSIAKILNIESEYIQIALDNFKAPEYRGKIIKKNSITIIDDSYNANFQSMKLGLDWVSNLIGYNVKIVVIGEMNELGDMSEKLHIDLGKLISKLSIDYVLCIGLKTKDIIKNIINPKIFTFYFESKSHLSTYLKSIINKNDLIYIKGSRSNNLDTIVEDII